MSPVVIISAVVAVVAILVVVGILAGRQKEPSAPARQDCTLDQAWEHYVSNAEKWSRRDQRAIKKLDRLEAESLKELRQSLTATLEAAAASATPQVILRGALMEATDRFALAEALFEVKISESGEMDAPVEAPSDMVERVVEAGVLRCFSMLRYGDYAREDWYTHYLNLSVMNSKNVAGMVKKTLHGKDSSLETSLHEPLTQSMQEVRNALLEYPARTPVERADKLTAGKEALPLYPSQNQVDQLTGIMSVRFEKLFSGQIYHLAQGASVDPAVGFQVDAGILYTLLSQHFRHPTDAWRKIMDESLGNYRGAMQNEEEVLSRVREYCSLWQANEADGPLNAVLIAACGTDPNAPAAGTPEAKRQVSGMMENAGPLVGSIRDIVERS